MSQYKIPWWLKWAVALPIIGLCVIHGMTNASSYTPVQDVRALINTESDYIEVYTFYDREFDAVCYVTNKGISCLPGQHLVKSRVRAEIKKYQDAKAEIPAILHIDKTKESPVKDDRYN